MHIAIRIRRKARYCTSGSPDGCVPFGLEAFSDLGATGLDDSPIDQDVDPIRIHVAEDAAVVRDDQHAE